MRERICFCGEPIPDERNARAKYCSRECAVYVAHANQNERIFGRRGPAPEKPPRPPEERVGCWFHVGPGHWRRKSKRFALEVCCSPEGFDWTVRDVVTGALLTSEIACRATLAKHRAMAAARDIANAGEPSSGRTIP